MQTTITKYAVFWRIGDATDDADASVLADSPEAAERIIRTCADCWQREKHVLGAAYAVQKVEIPVPPPEAFRRSEQFQEQHTNQE